METTKTLPTTVSEILNVARSVFADPAAVSCVIDTTWGQVEVTRNLEVKAL